MYVFSGNVYLLVKLLITGFCFYKTPFLLKFCVMKNKKTPWLPTSVIYIGLLFGLSLTWSFRLYAQEKFLQIDKTSLYEPAEDGNDTVTIRSGVSWALDFCPPFNMGKRTGGPGTTRVILHFARNPSANPVFTHIRIEPSGSSGIRVIMVDVIQAGTKPFTRSDKQDVIVPVYLAGASDKRRDPASLSGCMRL
jgi:hypothetical protein